MPSKGSRFTPGVWGLRLCSPDVWQPFATVRNRSCVGPMAVPMASSAKKRSFFGGFKRCVASFRVAGMALCDIPTCFIICRKSFLCSRRNASASFSEDELQFSWQAQHIGDLHRHFAWRAQHFRIVVLGVFCQSHCQGCVKW